MIPVATVERLSGLRKKRWGNTAELASIILDFLPSRAAHIAVALGRKSSDGTVRRALKLLEQRGDAEQVDGVWQCAGAAKIAKVGNPKHCPACGSLLQRGDV